ncbi:RDD family protein [Candidatus Sumerlaeota bacterium]|nr:RDD family protein [Candidatus Sumerlaeota bacterium]
MSQTIQPELTPPTTDGVSPSMAVPGFLVRALALILDVIVLTVLFYLLANRAYEALYPNRLTWQVLSMVGVAAYFALGSSALVRGQTVGKKMVGIRTVSLDGSPLSFGRAALRGVLVFAIVTAYVLLPQVVPLPLLGSLLDMMWMAGVLPPRVTLGWVIAIQIASVVSVGFALVTTFSLVMHPKKRALHDLAAGTGVVYERTPEAGLAFLQEWNEYYERKSRSLRWPMYFVGVAVLILLPQIVAKSRASRRSLEPLRVAERTLRDGGLEPFAVLGPSERLHREFVKGLDRREARRLELIAQGKSQEAERYKRPSEEVLRNAYDGRKFVFRFQLDESRTTESLHADPRFVETMDRLPALAETLSSEFFVERFASDGKVYAAEEGDEATSGVLRPSPYTAINTTFIEALPLFLYTKVKWTWTKQIPVTGHELPDDIVSESTDRQEPPAATGEETPGATVEETKGDEEAGTVRQIPSEDALSTPSAETQTHDEPTTR